MAKLSHDFSYYFQENYELTDSHARGKSIKSFYHCCQVYHAINKLKQLRSIKRAVTAKERVQARVPEDASQFQAFVHRLKMSCIKWYWHQTK